MKEALRSPVRPNSIKSNTNIWAYPELGPTVLHTLNREPVQILMADFIAMPQERRAANLRTKKTAAHELIHCKKEY